MIEGTGLFHRVFSFDYKDEKTARLVLEVWSRTPWMVDVFTGGHSNNYVRESDIHDWCVEHFGPEAWPIHGRPGNWHRGSATINGFTWMGFATQEMMDQFVSVWGKAKEETK